MDIETLLRELRGAGDTALTMGKNMAMQPFAGVAGITNALRAGVSGGDPMEAALETIQGAQGRAGGPTTPEGGRNLQKIGGAVETVLAPLSAGVDRVGAASPMAGAALAGLGGVIDPVKGGGRAAKAVKAAKPKAWKLTPEGSVLDAPRDQLGYDPMALRERYPEAGMWELAQDKKSGKEFRQKVLSPEEKAVAKMRAAAMREIEQGQYTPMFDVAKREHIPESAYPAAQSTQVSARPAKVETDAKYAEQFDTPGARQNLLDAYEAGSKDPLAKDWYAMQQYRQAMMDELGPEAGHAAFKERFADPVAATTGGADPQANLLTAQYTNFLRERGQPIPATAYDVPHPVGGRYLRSNLDSAQKIMFDGTPINAGEMPKRHNFSGNFQGQRGPLTIDEQMMSAMPPDPKTGKQFMAPPNSSYGTIEKIGMDLASEKGVPGSSFQDVAWKGLKDKKDLAAWVKAGKDPAAFVPDKSKPMIQQVNEAIHRTARVTGMTPQQALAHIIRNGPVYGMGGAAVGAGALAGNPMSEALRGEQ